MEIKISTIPDLNELENKAFRSSNEEGCAGIELLY
jgi:hypothetical protein